MRLAQVMAWYPEHHRPSAQLGSPAANDLADLSFDGPWGRGTFETCHDALPHITLIVDHLRGLAATTSAPQVTFSN